jgi:hypothetical protein
MVAGDAVGRTVVGIELLDAVTGATEAGLAAEEGVACPKILDIRLENIPIRTGRVKDRYCQKMYGKIGASLVDNRLSGLLG